MTDAWRKRPWSKTVSNLPTLGPKRPFTWAERYSTSSASAPLISANCLGESSYYLADNDFINICHEKLVWIYLAVLPSMSLESSDAPAVTSNLQIARSLQWEIMRIIWRGFFRLDLLVSRRLMESGVAFLIVHYINWKREWERVRIFSSWPGLLTYDSEIKAEKETQQNEIGCIFLSPIVWGAAPRRNFTTSGWPNLKKLRDKPNIGNFLPCAIVESSFGRLINCKQREALPVSKSYLLNPTSPHCGVV